MRYLNCDRCKKSFNYNPLPINFVGAVKRWDDERGGLFQVDLCMECVDNLEDWLNGKPMYVESRPSNARSSGGRQK